MKTTQYFILGRTRYEYSLEKINNEIVRFKCEKLGMDEEFLFEDIAQLIMDLPNIATNLKNYEKNKVTVKFRVTPTEKQKIIQSATSKGYKSTSDFVRERALA